MIADELATTLLASAPFAGLFSGKSLETIITWVVFVLCLFFSLLGIGASFHFWAKHFGVPSMGHCPRDCYWYD
jgi:hypothetical protein